MVEQLVVERVDEEKIRQRAYELWLEAGSPEGREDEFWHLAKEHLAKHEKDIDQASEQSFPASDAVNHM